MSVHNANQPNGTLRIPSDAEDVSVMMAGEPVRKEPCNVAVAVVDGCPEHRERVAAALGPFYHVATFGDGDHAVSGLICLAPRVIVVDEVVPPNGGGHFIERLRMLSDFAKVPIVYTTRDGAILAGEAGRMGAVAVVTKPYQFSGLLRTVSEQVCRASEAEWDKLAPEPRACLRKTVDLYNGISEMIDRDEPISYAIVKDACEPLLAAVHTSSYRSVLAGVRDHDNYSYVHSLRVATFLSLFGHTIGLNDDELMVLATGGLMHDVGKTRIPFAVLNKPGRLTPAEMDVMRTHVALWR